MARSGEGHIGLRLGDTSNPGYHVHLNGHEITQVIEANPYNQYVVVYMHSGRREEELPKHGWHPHVCQSCMQGVCLHVAIGAVDVSFSSERRRLCLNL